MPFDAFDTAELDKFKAEAKEKWGNTKEYCEYEKREKDGKKPADIMPVFVRFGVLRSGSPEDEAAQKQAAALQAFITANYYPCTDEMLAQLGEMYMADARFARNIDAAGGEGTAEFVREVIRLYTKRKP